MPTCNPVGDEPRKTAVVDHFDRSAELWDQLYEDDSRAIPVQYRVFMRQRVRLVLDACDSFAGQQVLRVLDLGCGAGKLGQALAERGHWVVGADLSEAMLRRALPARGGRNREAVSFLRADAELLPFRNNSFDVVCCLGLLEYLEHDRLILQQIDSLLRPGGLLVLTLPNLAKLCYLLDPYYYLVRGVDFAVHTLGGRRTHSPNADDVHGNRSFVVRRFLRGHLDGPLRERGYRLVSRDPVGFGPFTFWQRPLGSEEGCVRWSGRLDALCGVRGFHWFGFFANRWVSAYSKASQ